MRNNLLTLSYPKIILKIHKNSKNLFKLRTNYFSSGRFGGLIRLYFEMNQSLLKKMSTNEIKANAMGPFLEILKANGAYNGELQTVSL